jgi:hypothetical protein
MAESGHRVVAIGIAGREPPGDVEAIAAVTPAPARVAGIGGPAVDKDARVRVLAGLRVSGGQQAPGDRSFSGNLAVWLR